MAADSSQHYGTPGASARRVHAQRSERREHRVRDRHPRLGGLVLALSDEPQHQAAWERGASGEEMTAAALLKRCSGLVHVLHDLRIPQTRTNIDHVAVAPSGVWVIDSKRLKGKVEVRKPLLGRASLRVGGSDKAKLVDGLKRQVALVQEAVEMTTAGTPVHGCFCFVDSELPMFGTQTIEKLLILGRKGLAKRLNDPGPVAEAEVAALVDGLLGRFPFA